MLSPRGKRKGKDLDLMQNKKMGQIIICLSWKVYFPLEHTYSNVINLTTKLRPKSGNRHSDQMPAVPLGSAFLF